MAEATKKNLSFEQKEEKLTQIISSLENSKDLTLKETTELYTQGKDLLKSMNEELNELKKMVSNEIVKD